MNSTDQSEKKLLPTILPKQLVYLAQYLLVTFGGVGAVVSLFGDYSDGGDLLDEIFLNRAIYIVSILHLVLVVLVLFLGRLRIDDFYDFRKAYREKNKNKKSNIDQQEFIFNQSRQFIKYWTYIWMSWGVLYTIFFFDEYWKQITPNESTNFLYKLFTVDSADNGLSNPKQMHDVKLIIDFLMRLANNAGTYFMILLVITLMPDKNRNKLSNIFFQFLKKSCVIIPLIGLFDFILLFVSCYYTGLSISEAGEILSTIYGVLAATFLAMIAGRLDSYYFNAKPNWAYILFIYAALQASFPFYTDAGVSEIKITVAYTAFTLKGLFYVFVVKQFENWRMYYYLSAYSSETSWFTDKQTKSTDNGKYYMD